MWRRGVSLRSVPCLRYLFPSPIAEQWFYSKADSTVILYLCVCVCVCVCACTTDTDRQWASDSVRASMHLREREGEGLLCCHGNKPVSPITPWQLCAMFCLQLWLRAAVEAQSNWGSALHFQEEACQSAIFIFTCLSSVLWNMLVFFASHNIIMVFFVCLFVFWQTFASSSFPDVESFCFFWHASQLTECIWVLLLIKRFSPTSCGIL